MRDAIDADAPSREVSDDGFRSWSQLYQWAVNATTGAAAGEGAVPPKEDVRTEAQIGEDLVAAAEERKAVLEAMAADLPEMEGEIAVLEKAVAVLKDSTSGAGEVENALEVVAELCHSGDNGIDLHTIGGLEHVVRLVHDGAAPAAVHQAAGRALGTCVQNNPPVAQAAVELQCVAPLLRQAGKAEAPGATRARALMALAALVDSPHLVEAAEKESGMVVEAVKMALEGGEGVDGRRGMLRALALSEGLIRAEGVWKERFQGGVQAQVERIVGGSGEEDVVEAASRLARAMEL